MKDIDADYYGYRDDDDGILSPLELRQEQKSRDKIINEWVPPKDDDDDPNADMEIEETTQKPIPSQQDIQEALVARKKQELLEKYVL